MAIKLGDKKKSEGIKLGGTKKNDYVDTGIKIVGATKAKTASAPHSKGLKLGSQPVKSFAKPQELRSNSAYLQGIEEWTDEELVDKLSEIYNESDVEELYSSYSYYVNRYVMLQYLNKFDEEEIELLSYGALQEFYVNTYMAREMLKDPILSYMIKFSEFIKNSIDQDDAPGTVGKAGVMIFQDLPEDAYQMLLGGCEFNTMSFS